ncbi:MAG TPA: acyloxyacyl hydrolase [Ottowia sp.]|nr:acyloxyacyl hydrolase [Ottowia sp.]HNI86055.1 acyloxyacyl hydrolase [Ottowia sp.]HNJ44637.1 acyloxyacyl hydrolase [Ottowia sp.]HNN32680.1 acyloxyacyl hydrolase [Ottowia sp.]HNO42534.1 acyloxyacyl hydrolase [Ottowia sp.]
MTAHAHRTTRRHPRSVPRRPAGTPWHRLRRAGGTALLLSVLWGGAGAVQAQVTEGVDWSLSAAAAADAGVRKLGLIAGWTQAAPLWQGTQWRLRLRHEIELAAWHVPRARDLVELGYSPVLRLERPLDGAHATLFLEGSIGARLLSRTRVAPQRSLSTAFQFSDMLGVGVQWGTQARSTLGLRYQHVSNLGIKEPNPGMDFVQVYYTHRF